MTKEGAQSYGEVTKQKKQEVKLTTQEKRSIKAQKGKADYKTQAALHGGTKSAHRVLSLANAQEDTASTISSTVSNSTSQSGEKPKKTGKASKPSNVFDFGGFFRRSEEVDYNEPPTFYDSNKS